MKAEWTVVFVVLLLQGCAGPQVVSDSERSVVVRGVPRWTAEAQRLADERCAAHGRKARLVRLADEANFMFVFDCQQ